MQPEGSLPHSQAPATCPYPEHTKPVHASPSHFLEIHFNIILPSTPKSSKCTLSFSFTHQSPVWTSPLPLTSVYTGATQNTVPTRDNPNCSNYKTSKHAGFWNTIQ